MNEPVWLDVEIIVDLHAEQLALFGGPEGIRDQGMLESALGRPINKFSYGETDLAALAAAYAFGIARNHPFVDGNKRTALVVCETFIIDNGHFLAAPDAELVVVFENLASGNVSEDELAEWLREYVKRS
jgi:death-on-curing protein